MAGYSKYSDDEINQATEDYINNADDIDSQSANWLYLEDTRFCFNALIDLKLQFIPLEHGFEVRGFDKNGKHHIAQNKNANRAICECYLMIKEGE